MVSTSSSRGLAPLAATRTLEISQLQFATRDSVQEGLSVVFQSVSKRASVKQNRSCSRQLFFFKASTHKTHDFCRGNSFLSSESHHFDTLCNVNHNLPDDQQNNLHEDVLASTKIDWGVSQKIFCGPDSCTRNCATSKSKSLCKHAKTGRVAQWSMLPTWYPGGPGSDPGLFHKACYMPSSVD
jgi:hypothetical protein